MFKPNKLHYQTQLFAFSFFLCAAKQEELEKTPEFSFYKLIFCQIDEETFSVLYSDRKSRPNSPVNTMIAALILKETKLWSYDELFAQIDFDLRTRTALGLFDLDETPFCAATLFNFQNRLLSHYIETGEDLMERTFDHLTADQLKDLGIKTSIQRGDSFLAASNIRSYSRLQLLVEVLIRLHRTLSKAEKEAFSDLFSPYIKQTSGQYIYRLKNTDLSSQLDSLGQVYHTLHTKLAASYGDTAVFKIFDRVYTEHFTVANEKVQVIPSKELTSSCLQSPDDVDAAYRQKRDQESQGQSIHANETAHPVNQLNLITDVAIAPNNTDDSAILNDRLDKMAEKTPDLEELHTDGGYGSEDNDRKMEELDIVHIQTAIKGRTAAVPMTIEQTADDTYQVSCPHQTVSSQPTKTRHKACFDQAVCDSCPLADVCSTSQQKDQRVLYFDHDDYLRNKRHRAIEQIPSERRTIRPNVEATVREFKRRMPGGKLKVRGAFKTRMFAFLVASGINFGRIYRFQRAQADQIAQNQQKLA
jgi:hypothetical protein